MIHKIVSFKDGRYLCGCGAVHKDRVYQYGSEHYYVPEGAGKRVEKIRKHLVSECASIRISHYASLTVASTLKALAGVKTRSVNDRIKVDRCISTLANCIPESDVHTMVAWMLQAAKELS